MQSKLQSKINFKTFASLERLTVETRTKEMRFFLGSLNRFLIKFYSETDNLQSALLKADLQIERREGKQNAI